MGGRSRGALGGGPGWRSPAGWGTPAAGCRRSHLERAIAGSLVVHAACCQQGQGVAAVHQLRLQALLLGVDGGPAPPVLGGRLVCTRAPRDCTACASCGRGRPIQAPAPGGRQPDSTHVPPSSSVTVMSRALLRGPAGGGPLSWRWSSSHSSSSTTSSLSSSASMASLGGAWLARGVGPDRVWTRSCRPAALARGSTARPPLPTAIPFLGRR